jgi:hypothetical protein
MAHAESSERRQRIRVHLLHFQLIHGASFAFQIVMERSKNITIYLIDEALV